MVAKRKQKLIQENHEQSEDECDRELFLELLELPIRSLLIVPSFIEENNPLFMLKMNGEAAWTAKKLAPQTRHLLQACALPK